MIQFAQALRWDPTVSLGAVLSMLGIIITILAAAWRMTFKIEQAKADVSTLKDDVADMKPKVNMILVLQQQQVDHDRRMTRLEDAIFTKKP
jgi:hypothetical protein